MPASLPLMAKVSVTVLPVPAFLSLKLPLWLRVTVSPPTSPLKLPPLTVALVVPS
ncbi:hypothetical protein VPARA_44530 [Variovorax paradoxus]|uniref:Uncharacterized protein n=1 Tax=Variovorax paradoxus TaxID=34073 RepID=A0A0H2MC34_VARPD|nr:hypothetical protein VPARA_44530 [Variovorax paradoxus]